MSASLAFAQGNDVIFLPGGGRLRGTVEVYEPGRRVVVLLPDGTRRRLARGEFERVVFGDEAERDHAPSEAAPSPEPPPPDAAPPPDVAPPPAVAPPAEPPSIQLPPAPEGDPSNDPAQVLEAPAPEATSPAVPEISVPEVQTLEATGASTVSARAFGDGLMETVAWPEDDPGRIARPTGALHFGMQVHGRGRLGAPLSYGVEVAPYVDLRLALFVHVRALLVLGGIADQGTETERSGGPFGARTTRITGHGVFELAGRVLFGILASDGFAIRVGGQFGFEVLSHVERAEPFGDGVLELAGRVADSRLEILLTITAGPRTDAELEIASRAAGGVQDFGGASATLGAGLGLGYVFY